MRLEHMNYMYLAGIIPVCFVLFLLTSFWKRKMLLRFGEMHRVLKLIPDLSPNKTLLKFILFILALSCVITGILNPQAGSKPHEAKRRGSQILIALDVSNSMKAQDLDPNRLERAKRAISKLIDNLKGDEIGIIVFAGKAYVQLPLTTDYSAAKLLLDNINTDLVPTQGTSITSAVELATQSADVGGDEPKNKALIVITDGEDHEGGVLDAVADAAKKGMVIHTIGMGSPNGVPIPAYQGKTFIGYRKDKDGATIITKLNEQMLKEIAGAGHGLYIHASNTDIGLNSLQEEIGKMNKTESEAIVYDDYDDYFRIFIWAAFILLLLETLIPERRSKLYARLNLFGELK